MDIITTIIFFIPSIILFIMVLYLFNVVQQNALFTLSLSELVSRTFREYYKGEDIEPRLINNGVDLVWKGEVEGGSQEDNPNGFIAIYTKDSGINSPINSIDDADILAGKISHVVYEYIKDKEKSL